MKRFVESYDNHLYDLIVIGGGITGAAVAYDAATRGFSVALVERRDFGGATSAATSKMIHGGLRYLQNAEFRVVRESLKERRVLSNIAPNFVYPIPFLLINPDYLIKAGMILYDLLSFDKGKTWDKSKRIPWHRSLSAENTRCFEPITDTPGLRSSVVFYDCINISPERLTLAFIKSAVSYGASVSNYAELTGFLYSDEGEIDGVQVKDLINDRSLAIRGQLTINCAGPWSDRLLGLAERQDTAGRVRHSQGIHLITRKLVDKYVVSALNPRGGRVTLMPWRKHTLIGITDTEYLGDPDDYAVTKQSIVELVDSVNLSLGKKELLRFEDVLFAYGGLRPLAGDLKGDLYHSSRKHEIRDNARDGLNGLITVKGGKYTTSRHLAEKTIDLATAKLKRQPRPCVTARKRLIGCQIPDMPSYIEQQSKEYPEFEKNTIEHLARIYGTELADVLKIGREERRLSEPINDDGEILAQVVYAVRHEMAYSMNDIIFRRTGIGTLGNPGSHILRAVAETAALESNWDVSRQANEIETALLNLKLPT